MSRRAMLWSCLDRAVRENQRCFAASISSRIFRRERFELTARRWAIGRAPIADASPVPKPRTQSYAKASESCSKASICFRTGPRVHVRNMARSKARELAYDLLEKVG